MKKDLIVVSKLSVWIWLWSCDPTGQSMYVSNVDVRSMLPENLNNFYRYEGSLTTPPCFESVIWTVFGTPIALTQNQVCLSLKKKKKSEKYYERNCNRSWTCLLCVVFRSGNWRAPWWTLTTRFCPITTASHSRSTTAWFSLHSCLDLGEEERDDTDPEQFCDGKAFSTDDSSFEWRGSQSADS